MHSIRLRGPWELYLPESEAPRRVEMPATWQTLRALAAESPLPSPVRLVRRFGLPTGLAPGDQLYLKIDSTAACQVQLNNMLVGSTASTQQTNSFEVTPLLSARNELVVLLEIPPLDSRQPESNLPLFDVRLEIAAFG